MAGKDVERAQGLCRTNYLRPVGDIGVAGEVVGAVDGGIAGAEKLFLGQVDEAVAARVSPAEEVETHLARAVLQDEGTLVEGLPGWFGSVEFELGDVGTLLGRGLPARWFVALHLFGDTDVGQGGGAGLGPDGIAVGVVAMVMSIE